jgi:hypothetical protein
MGVGDFLGSVQKTGGGMRRVVGSSCPRSLVARALASVRAVLVDGKKTTEGRGRRALRCRGM